MTSHRWLILFFILGMMTGRSPVSATVFTIPTWQQLVQSADFIGVVECVTAGGVVARYRVEDSWLGMEKGSEFLLEQYPDYLGDQYPTSLCGERILLMAKKKHASEVSNIQPLFWTIPADYYALGFGMWGVSSNAGLKKFFGDSDGSLEKVKLIVRRFLQASEDEKERELILSVAQRNYYQIFTEMEPSEENKNSLGKVESIIASLKKQPDVKSLVKELLRIAPNEEGEYLLKVLEEGGGQSALELLNAESTTIWRSGSDSNILNHHRAKEEIFKRLGNSAISEEPPPALPKEDVSISLEGKLIKARQKMRSVEKRDPSEIRVFDPSNGEEFSASLELLITHDPDFLSDLLVNWIRSDHVTGGMYDVAQDFYLKCQKDREDHFIKLHKAKDPFVKVLAAIHLYFENKELGLKSLQSCSELSGNEGAWAALTLARRGDRTALKQALKVFAPDEKAEYATYEIIRLRYVLQQRLLILLSNSAKASQLPSPPSFDNYFTYYPEFGAGLEDRLLRLKVLEKWWDEHSDSIKLYDPWLEILDKVKRD